MARLTEAVVAPEFHLAEAVVAEEAARPMVGSLGDGCQEPLVLHYTSQGAPQDAHSRRAVQTCRHLCQRVRVWMDPSLCLQAPVMW